MSLSIVWSLFLDQWNHTDCPYTAGSCGCNPVLFSGHQYSPGDASPASYKCTTCKKPISMSKSFKRSPLRSLDKRNSANAKVDRKKKTMQRKFNKYSTLSDGCCTQCILINAVLQLPALFPCSYCQLSQHFIKQTACEPLAQLPM